MTRINLIVDLDNESTSYAVRPIFEAVRVLLRVPNRFHSFFLAESVLNRY
jgi:hypothetical protein